MFHRHHRRNQGALQPVHVIEALRRDLLVELERRLPGDAHVFHGVGDVLGVEGGVHPVLRLQGLIQINAQLSLSDRRQIMHDLGLAIVNQIRGDEGVVQLTAQLDAVGVENAVVK